MMGYTVEQIVARGHWYDRNERVDWILYDTTEPPPIPPTTAMAVFLAGEKGEEEVILAFNAKRRLGEVVGLWEVIGGHPLANETIAGAQRRETEEETGCDLLDHRAIEAGRVMVHGICGVCEATSENDIINGTTGQPYDNPGFMRFDMFGLKEMPKSFNPTGEMKDCRVFPVNALPQEKMHPINIAVIGIAVQRYRQTRAERADQLDNPQP